MPKAPTDRTVALQLCLKLRHPLADDDLFFLQIVQRELSRTAQKPFHGSDLLPEAPSEFLLLFGLSIMCQSNPG
jgi:hypothetical protein